MIVFGISPFLKNIDYHISPTTFVLQKNVFDPLNWYIIWNVCIKFGGLLSTHNFLNLFQQYG
jgi:hypothetical protein